MIPGLQGLFQQGGVAPSGIPQPAPVSVGPIDNPYTGQFMRQAVDMANTPRIAPTAPDNPFVNQPAMPRPPQDFGISPVLEGSLGRGVPNSPLDPNEFATTITPEQINRVGEYYAGIAPPRRGAPTRQNVIDFYSVNAGRMPTPIELNYYTDRPARWDELINDTGQYRDDYEYIPPGGNTSSVPRRGSLLGTGNASGRGGAGARRGLLL